MTLSPKIILVEDDNDLREMYKRKLEMEGYKISTAKDGISALSVIEKNKFDLILLDILIPKKDGFEVLQSIRSSKNDKLRSIPVLIISNLSSEEDRKEAEKIGISGYLIKSETTLAKFVETVKTTLSPKNSYVESN